MAQLLGSKYCIESLRNDITDLQETIVDVISRVGPVRYPSWKYPDKVSCDLDLTELLELYDYSEDEVERQIAHVVLMELVIDRFVLLTQSLSKYMEGNLMKKEGNDQKNSHHSSVGLVARKFWNKIVQANSTVQQFNSDNKNLKRKMADLENQVTKYSEEAELLRNNIASTEEVAKALETCKTPFPLNDNDTSLVRALTSASNYSISKDEYNKSVQTYETAFVPCESCHNVQKSFREVGDTVVSVCRSQGLPSSLAKYKTLVEGLDWMTGNDVARWAAEQNKDMSRINKHLSGFVDTVGSLNTEVSDLSSKNKDLQQKMVKVDKDIKLEKETSRTQRKQYETKIEEIKKESSDQMDLIRRENAGLIKTQREAETQVKVMKEKLEEQKEMLSVLEMTKNKLEEKVEQNEANHHQVRGLEEQISKLNAELRSVCNKLEETEGDLSKERAKVKSASKHTEAVQGKQSNLLARIDDLDQENEDLREQVGELEDQKDQLEEQLDRVREERDRMEDDVKENKDQDSEDIAKLKALVAELEREKSSLEAGMEELKGDIEQLESKLTEAKERERLIVDYPDLNGPVNPDIVGTGDIAVDMENQVKANSVRIQVLEEQNLKLRGTITKMLQRQQMQGQMPSQPVPLWANPNANVPEQPPADTYNHRHRQYSPSEDPHQYNLPPRPPPKKQTNDKPREQVPVSEFVVGLSTKKGSSRGLGGRPPSRPTSASNKEGSSSMAAYKSLKKSGLLSNNRNRPSSAKSNTTDYTPPDVHVCTRCDKMYNNAKDLDIHKSYCYG